MKRNIFWLLIIALCLSLCACGDGAKQEEYDKAMTYPNSGMLDNALVAFIELGDYNDTPCLHLPEY